MGNCTCRASSEPKGVEEREDEAANVALAFGDLTMSFGGPGQRQLTNESVTSEILSKGSAKPCNPPFCRAITPPLFHRLSSLPDEHADIRNSSPGGTGGTDYRSGEGVRDSNEEIAERNAELDEGGVGEVSGHGVLSSNQVATVMKRLHSLRKSKSDLANVTGEPKPVMMEMPSEEEAKRGELVHFRSQASIHQIEMKRLSESHFAASQSERCGRVQIAGADTDEQPTMEAKRNFRRSRSLSMNFGSNPSTALQLVIENSRNIELIYALDRKELGHGSFGSVRKAVVKATGAVRAVKCISKDKMKDTMRLLKMEIRISKMVDHPHIIKLYELFEDLLNVYLVMEICSGGQLHEYVKHRGPLSEPICGSCLQQLVRAVVYLHDHYICHRDIKPENILLSAEEPLVHNSLKLTDFGVSCLFKPKQVLTARVGTTAYMAPQVITKSYNELCDTWSCGVVLYYLFSGQIPFAGSTIKEIQQRICSGNFKLTKEFADISEEGHGIMLKLLLVDQNARLTARQCLQHPWFVKHGPKMSEIVIPSSIFDALQIFRSQNKFKRSALCLIASLLSKEQIKEAHEAFRALDKDGDGIVSVSEIRDRLRKDSATKSIPGVSRILRAMDKACKDDFEDVTYTEFIAANLDRDRYITEDVCRAAFSVFDQDGDGFITKDELLSGEMFGQMTQAEVSALVQDLDSKGYEQVDYEDFARMMQEVPKTPKSKDKRVNTWKKTAR